MFQESEGLSTYIVADYLAGRPGGGRFVSIECDPNHVEACKEIIDKRDRSLSQYIDYRQGHSLSILPEVLAEIDEVHFFYLDGGAHPEVCLVEFELAMSGLASGGAILVDDAHEISPSENYGLPRPLGKATLILPMLILSEYVLSRKQVQGANSIPGDPKTVPDSPLVGQFQLSCFDSTGLAYVVIGRRHRMLAYGRPSFVSFMRGLDLVGAGKGNSIRRALAMALYPVRRVAGHIVHKISD